MPSNNSSGIVHYLSGKYSGKIGYLFSPKGWFTPNYYMPYALDNGCFTNWDEEAFFDMLYKTKGFHKPLWVCCPDAVADAELTLKRWHQYSKRILDLNFRIAFVIQDGMEPQDVPDEAYAVFVGGSTDWKLKNAERFNRVAPWFHIGRVNTIKRLYWAERIKADSVDGTGFFRGKGEQYRNFLEYFEKSIYFSINDDIIKPGIMRNNPEPYKRG